MGGQRFGLNGRPYEPSDPVRQRGEGACLTQETHGTDLEAEPLVGFPKVIEHDVDDGQLVDAGGVDLQHGPGVTLSELHTTQGGVGSGEPVRTRTTDSCLHTWTKPLAHNGHRNNSKLTEVTINTHLIKFIQ